MVYSISRSRNNKKRAGGAVQVSALCSFDLFVIFKIFFKIFLKILAAILADKPVIYVANSADINETIVPILSAKFALRIVGVKAFATHSVYVIDNS